MELRQEIDHLIAKGDARSASRLLRELWEQEKGSAAASFVTSRFENLRRIKNFMSHRLAILRSFTLEPVIPLLRATAFVHGIDLAVHLGDFNAYSQEILDAESSLYSFAPDSVILAVQTRDITPDLWSGYADLTDETVRASITRAVGCFQSWIKTFRQHCSANLIIHALEQPPTPSLGVMDAQSELGQSAAIRQMNDGLRSCCQQFRGVYLLDYGSLLARHGYDHWHDEKKWLTARMPIAAGSLIHLSHEWLRFLLPLSGRMAKAIVVDLDNTLWGGIIGEDGFDGIRLGQEYPGAAYQALQRALLDLHRKGILLAICSKNNLEDAREAIEKHPGMLLKPEQFAAIRINWSDKVQNLREIAAELNIGVDSLAFLDDNPVERARVRISLPEVSVIELGSDPATFAASVRDAAVFERLALSDEDRKRSAFYAAERERSIREQGFASKEDFFRSLEQEAEIRPLGPGNLARISQLTQKTNQFNLTTRRYSEQQISEIAARPESQVLSVRVRDRFGDHGIVGVAITQQDGACCEIDTFLLSCRVIGRSVETAFLSYLVESAQARGMKSMRGWFVPTKKNAPAKSFYPEHGFKLESTSGAGSLWVLNLETAHLACPEWVTLRIANEVRG